MLKYSRVVAMMVMGATMMLPIVTPRSKVPTAGMINPKMLDIIPVRMATMMT
jgi:hypothetical protein